MGQIHRWLGLAVGLVVPGWQDRRQQKRASTPATSPTAPTTSSASTTSATTWPPPLADKVQRGHVYAIVDEVDSILIDEARTPLIISGRVADAAKLYYQFASIVRSLRRDVDYEVDEEKRTVAPTEDGIEKVEQALGVENLYDEVQQNLVHQLPAALKAKELYKRDKDYIIQDGEVKIVDEFTGRILEGRRWSEGLHQAVEAKEGVKIKEENQTLATITLQNYFRLYDKLAGMTGTAAHRGRRARRHLRPAGRAHPDPPADGPRRPGRPHLQDRGGQVRRRRRRHRRALRDGPAGAGRHRLGREVRAAVQPAAQAGHPPRGAQRQAAHPGGRRSSPRPAGSAAVTVATNMAGRGVDILLGGNPEGLAREEVLRRASRRGAVDECNLPVPLDQLPEDDRKVRAEAQARYDELLEKFTRRVRGRGRQGPRARRALRARHRAPREPAHRQPAAGPLGPPGRPRREPLLPVASRTSSCACSPPAP